MPMALPEPPTPPWHSHFRVAGPFRVHALRFKTGPHKIIGFIKGVNFEVC
jgi:hypothetical protein